MSEPGPSELGGGGRSPLQILAEIETNPFPYTRHYIPRLVYFLLIFEDHFSFLRTFFLKNSVLTYSLYSRAGYNGARTVYGLLLHLIPTIFSDLPMAL